MDRRTDRGMIGRCDPLTSLASGGPWRDTQRVGSLRVPALCALALFPGVLALAGCRKESDLSISYNRCVAPYPEDPHFSTFALADDERTLTIKGGMVENTVVAHGCLFDRL